MNSVGWIGLNSNWNVREGAFPCFGATSLFCVLTVIKVEPPPAELISAPYAQLHPTQPWWHWGSWGYSLNDGVYQTETASVKDTERSNRETDICTTHEHIDLPAVTFINWLSASDKAYSFRPSKFLPVTSCWLRILTVTENEMSYFLPFLCTTTYIFHGSYSTKYLAPEKWMCFIFNFLISINIQVLSLKTDFFLFWIHHKWNTLILHYIHNVLMTICLFSHDDSFN